MHKPHILSENAGAAEIRELLFRGHADVREAFNKAFGPEIEACIDAIANVYAKYRAFEHSAPRTKRTAQVQLFFYTALNSIVSSLYLLISGFLTPSGHLMRQYAEATAMALLCSSPALMTFARLEKEGERYPVHDALREVNKTKNRKLLDVNPEGWATFINISKIYDQYSHASSRVVAVQYMFDREGMLVMLGDFDTAKTDVYHNEFARRRTAAIALEQMIVELHKRVPFDPNELDRDGSASTT